MGMFRDYATGKLVTVNADHKKQARKRFLAVHLGIAQGAGGKLGCNAIADVTVTSEDGVHHDGEDKGGTKVFFGPAGEPDDVGTAFG